MILAVRPADRRRAAGGRVPARRARRVLIGGRARAGRLRRAALGGVGLGHPQGRTGRRCWACRPTIWLILAGVLIDLGLLRVGGARRGRGARTAGAGLDCFANRQMTGGLVMFFFQYLVQAGLFFTIPLFLSVSLGLSALETGVRILPLSITLLLAAVGVPKVFPQASPRRVVRLGLLAMFAGSGGPVRGARRGRDRQDRHRAAAARGPRDRRPGLAAGRGHRVRGPGRAEPGRGGPAEHRDEPRARRSAPRWRGRSSSPR